MDFSIINVAISGKEALINNIIVLIFGSIIAFLTLKTSFKSLQWPVFSNANLYFQLLGVARPRSLPKSRNAPWSIPASALLLFVH